MQNPIFAICMQSTPFHCLEKHTTLKLLNFADMPRLDKVNRERAIGMLDAGLSQVEIARYLLCIEPRQISW